MNVQRVKKKNGSSIIVHTNINRSGDQDIKGSYKCHSSVKNLASLAAIDDVHKCYNYRPMHVNLSTSPSGTILRQLHMLKLIFIIG